MAAVNTVAIYSKAPDIQWIESVVTAHNVVDLTSGTSYLVWTADATNGGFLDHIRVKVNPAASSAATVVRFWINNGATLGTAANSALFGELSIPATTTIATAALPDFVYPVGFPIPATYRIYATVGTAPGGSAELTIIGVGGKY